MSEALGTFLQGLHGRQVYFDALGGNQGDTLITLAARDLLGKAGVTLTRKAAGAGMIILNGGGSMVDGWPGLQKLQRYSRHYPDTPLAVLPSSFLFSRTDPAALFDGRRAAVWLFSRERESLRQLRMVSWPCEVNLGLDHDLALSLGNHRCITSRRDRTAAAHALIVERDDWEGPTGRQRLLAIPGLSFMPVQLRAQVRRHLLGWMRQRQEQVSPFNKTAMEFLVDQGHVAADDAAICQDISLPEVCDFDCYLDAIAEAAVIVTTRLHVAIVAHLLNKACYLVEGRYHKYRGVYDHSLDSGSVRFVRWNGVQLTI